MVFPGSALFKSPPQWMISAEIIETSRVYARTNARIDIGWTETIAKHLLKYSYSNPHWEKKRSQVVAFEQASLYGLIIYTDRKVNYARISPAESREIFIRSALVHGELEGRADFYKQNQQLLKELESLEAKSRRRDIIVDENVLYDFYDSRLPDDIYSGAKLDKWLSSHPEKASTLLLSSNELIRDNATLVSEAEFPDTVEMNGSRFPIEYHFDPDHHCDGITLITPLAGINAVNPQRCEWLIPGLLHEKIIALIKSLPKQLRKNFVPAPDFAAACVQALKPSDTALATAVSAHLKKMTGVQIPYDAWNFAGISPHLLMNFRVVGSDGKVIKEARDLQAIKDSLSATVVEATALNTEHEPDTRYNRDNVGPEILDSLDETVELRLQGITIKAYPALVRKGSQVNLRALDSKKIAAAETHRALRQLVINALPEQIKYLKASIPDIQNLCLKYTDFGRCDDLKQDIVNKIIDDVFLYDDIGSQKQFISRLKHGKSELSEKAKQWSRLLTGILDEYRGIKMIMKKPSLLQLDTITDIKVQLDHLFPQNFITVIDPQWLQQYPRYLKGIRKRFEKSQTNALRDRQLRLEFSSLWQEYIKRQESLNRQHIDSEQLNHYRWMLEEYRISLFAQELKTLFPISEKRLKKYWDELSDV
jgi:ATP-dependent helicase HrpA